MGIVGGVRWRCGWIGQRDQTSPTPDATPFDLFDVHLYGDVATITDDVATARPFMREHGYRKPVVVGEHAGPVVFTYPEAAAAMHQVLASAFAAPPGEQSTAELAQQAGDDTPERRAMRTLHARMDELPEQLQMFMAGCPEPLEAKRNQINAREVVTRTLLALATGVRRTAYWDLAPEILFGKLFLLGYDGDATLGVRHPAGDAFARLAKQIRDAGSVTALPAHGHLRCARSGSNARARHR